MIDADALAGMSCPGRLDDPSVGCRPDRRAASDAVVLSDMDVGTRARGVQAPAETAGDPGAFDRCGEGQTAGQQPCGADGHVLRTAAGRNALAVSRTTVGADI